MAAQQPVYENEIPLVVLAQQPEKQRHFSERSVGEMFKILEKREHPESFTGKPFSVEKSPWEIFIALLLFRQI